MSSEWRGRVNHWIRTLKEDFYEPLGEFVWEALPTMDYLTQEEALQKTFEPVKTGFTWGKAYEYCWFKSSLILPEGASGEKIVLNLQPGGESTLFVNGKGFGTYRALWVDQPHHFIEDNVLTDSGKPGERFDILMETYAGHYIPETPSGGCCTGPVLPGAYLDPKKDGERCVLGSCTYGIWNETAYQLFMDVDTLAKLLDVVDENSLRAAKIAKALEQFTLTVDFEQGREERNRTYERARKELQPALKAENGTTAPRFYAIGNAHLDLAWLWPMAETYRKTERTFAAQLRLLEKYPEYKFLQSQPASYEMCRRYYPELFERVRAAIKKGNWIAEGAMWVEPDTNMAGGEALIRQLVHGIRYYREVLGVESKVLWLPDTFGYTAALPQILKGCGVKYLVTQKIFWSYNEGEPFPYHYFNWEGMDGTRIVSFLPTSYTYRTDPEEINRTWKNRTQKQDLDAFLLPYGYGDGGGGPSRDFIEYARRQVNLEGGAKVRLAGPVEFFTDMEKQGGPVHTYAGELYFSAHRGTYTSQARIKQYNRRCELALREMEMWGCLAKLKGYDYDLGKADALWKELLLHQFHDILPGSAIAKVYKDAEKALKGVLTEAEALTGKETKALTRQEAGEAVTVFNSLGFVRKALITLPESFASGAAAAEGGRVPVQSEGGTVKALVTLPSCGAVTLVPCGSGVPFNGGAAITVAEDGYQMENDLIVTKVNKRGEITSFVLKASGRDFAAAPMNRFHLYKDVPRLFDAWDIDSNYVDQEVEAVSRITTEIIAEGLEAVLKVSGAVGGSAFTQYIRLRADSKRLEFETEIDWRELHRLLKTAFPVNVYAENGINEIQFGYVERPAHRSRLYDKDRFEVCNHRYSAFCDGSHGAAVLNDCKYGISMNGNSLELTLLRAAASPQMRADNRVHHFTYGFTAWEGSFMDSDVVKQGYELNVKPLVTAGSVETFTAVKVEKDNIILDTLKPAEDGSSDMIWRLYESKKAAVRTRVECGFGGFRAYLCDMLEHVIEEIPVRDGVIELEFRAFEVKTVRIIMDSTV